MGTKMGTMVDDRGRITLPLSLREELGLRPGTVVQAERVEQGILIRQVMSRSDFVAAFEGCVDSSKAAGPPIDPLTVKRMWEPFHDHD